jgi:hypothetical protein
MEVGWSFLWNVTGVCVCVFINIYFILIFSDETVENCDLLIDNGGLELFVQCFEVRGFCFLIK